MSDAIMSDIALSPIPPPNNSPLSIPQPSPDMEVAFRSGSLPSLPLASFPTTLDDTQEVSEIDHAPASAASSSKRKHSSLDALTSVQLPIKRPRQSGSLSMPFTGSLLDCKIPFMPFSFTSVHIKQLQ